MERDARRLSPTGVIAVTTRLMARSLGCSPIRSGHRKLPLATRNYRASRDKVDCERRGYARARAQSWQSKARAKRARGIATANQLHFLELDKDYPEDPGDYTAKWVV
jgi:hypothetical protein